MAVVYTPHGTYTTGVENIAGAQKISSAPPSVQAAVSSQEVIEPPPPLIKYATGALRATGPRLMGDITPTQASLGGIIGGAIAGQALRHLGIPGLPGGEYEAGAILPGGEPFRVPDLPTGDIVKRWFTGTTNFALDSQGHYWVAKKVRRRGLPDTYIWKRYRPGGSIVIGKQLNSRNLNKAWRALNRFKGRARKLKIVVPGGR